jgi:hypothetical protein
MHKEQWTQDGCISHQVFSQKEARRPLGLSPRGFPHILGIFCLFPQSTVVLLNLMKNQRHKKIFKNHQRSSPIFALSNYTVPLLAKLKLVQQSLSGIIEDKNKLPLILSCLVL